ncbi:MAG: tyrosine-protein phosphatase [Candidatus Obscuribacterales bacterium]
MAPEDPPNKRKPGDDPAADDAAEPGDSKPSTPVVEDKEAAHDAGQDLAEEAWLRMSDAAAAVEGLLGITRKARAAEPVAETGPQPRSARRQAGAEKDSPTPPSTSSPGGPSFERPTGMPPTGIRLALPGRPGGRSFRQTEATFTADDGNAGDAADRTNETGDRGAGNPPQTESTLANERLLAALNDKLVARGRNWPDSYTLPDYLRFEQRRSALGEKAVDLMAEIHTATGETIGDTTKLRNEKAIRELLSNPPAGDAAAAAKYAELLSGYESYLKQQKQYERDRKPFDTAMENRARILSGDINSFFADQKRQAIENARRDNPSVDPASVDVVSMPQMKIKIGELDGALATYDGGTGDVTVRPVDVLTSGMSAPLRMRLAHELTHGEQDRLVVDYLAGKAGIKPGEAGTPEQLEALRRSYLHETKSSLEAGFMKSCLQTRTRPLTKKEGERAEALIASKQEKVKIRDQIALLDGRREAIDAAVRAIKEPGERAGALRVLTPLAHMDANGRYSRMLFGEAGPPADVKKLIDDHKSGKPIDPEFASKTLLGALEPESKRCGAEAERLYLGQTHEVEAAKVTRMMEKPATTTGDVYVSPAAADRLLKSLFPAATEKGSKNTETSLAVLPPHLAALSGAATPAERETLAQKLITDSRLHDDEKKLLQDKLKDKTLSPESAVQILQMHPDLRLGVYEPLLKGKPVAGTAQTIDALLKLEPSDQAKLTSLPSADFTTMIRGMNSGTVDGAGVRSWTSMNPRQREIWGQQINLIADGKPALYNKENLRLIMGQEPRNTTPFEPGNAFDQALKNKTMDQSTINDILLGASNPSAFGAYAKLDIKTAQLLIYEVENPQARSDFEHLVDKNYIDGAMVQKLHETYGKEAISPEVTHAVLHGMYNNIVDKPVLEKILAMEPATRDIYMGILRDQDKLHDGNPPRQPRSESVNTASLQQLITNKTPPERLQAFRDALSPPGTEAPALNGPLLKELVATPNEAQDAYLKLINSGAADRNAVALLLQNRTSSGRLENYIKAIDTKVITPADFRKIASAPDEVRDLFERTILPGELGQPRILGESNLRTLIDNPSIATEELPGLHIAAQALGQEKFAKLLSGDEQLRKQAAGFCEKSPKAAPELLRQLASVDGALTVDALKRCESLLNELPRNVEARPVVDQAAKLLAQSAAPDFPGGKLTPVRALEMATVMQLSGIAPGADAAAQAAAKLKTADEVRQQLGKPDLPLKEALAIHERKRFYELKDYADAVKLGEEAKAIEDVAAELGHRPAAEDYMQMAAYRRQRVAAGQPDVQLVNYDDAHDAGFKTREWRDWNDHELALLSVPIKRVSEIRAASPDLTFQEALQVQNLTAELDRTDRRDIARELLLYSDARGENSQGLITDLAQLMKDHGAPEQVERWKKLAEALNGNDRLAAALTRDLAEVTQDPALCFDIAKRMTPDDAARLQNPRMLSALMKSATLDRLNGTDVAFPGDITKMLHDAALRMGQSKDADRMGSNTTEQQAFARAWADMLEANRNVLGYKVTDESTNAARFEMLRNLTAEQIAGLSKENIQHLTYAIDSRLSTLPVDARAQLVSNLVSGTRANDRVDKATRERLLTQLVQVTAIDHNVLNHLKPADARELVEVARKELARREADKPERLGRTEDNLKRLAEKLFPDPINREAAEKLFGHLTGAERERAIDYLESRQAYLSTAGLRAEFADVLADLRSHDLLQASAERGRPIEKLTALCLTSEGRALAYEFRKLTGIAVDVIGPGDPIPSGTRMVLFDSPDKLTAGQKLTGPQLQQLVRDGQVYESKSLTAFGQGVNLFDLQAAKQNPSAARDKIDHEIGATSKPGGATTAITDVELTRLQTAVDKPVKEARQAAIERGMLHMVGLPTERALIESQLYASNPDIISNQRMMAQAAEVHSKLMTERGLSTDGTAKLPSNLVFVAMDRDGQRRADSSMLALHMYRVANGLTDPKYDSHFLSFGELKARIEQAKRTGEKLDIVVLNDLGASYKEANDIITRLRTTADNSGAKASITYAAFVGYQKDMASATEGIKDARVITGEAPLPSYLERIERNLGELGRDYSVPKDVLDGVLRRQSSTSGYGGASTGAVFEHMYANTTAAPAADLMSAMGIAGASSELKEGTERHLGAQGRPMPEGADAFGRNAFKIGGIANGGEVNDQLWRGGRPTREEAVKKLAESGVKVIVDLTLTDDAKGQERSRQEKAWCEKYGIEYVSIPTSTSKMTPQSVAAIVERLQAEGEAGRKVFLHCEHGRDRTGAVIAAYRQVQGGSFAEAREEMNAYGFSELTPGANKTLNTVREVFGQPPVDRSADAVESRPGFVVPHIQTEGDRRLRALITEEAKAAESGDQTRIDAARDALRNEVVQQMKGLAKELGIPPELITPNMIHLDENMASAVFSPTDATISLNTRIQDLTATLAHEMRHLDRMMRRTALFMADPAAATEAMAHSVSSNIGNGRTRVTYSDGEVRVDKRAVLDDVTRRAMSEVLLSTVTDKANALTSFYSTKDVVGIMANLHERDRVRYDALIKGFGGDGKGGQADQAAYEKAVKELRAELNHFAFVKDGSIFNAGQFEPREGDSKSEADHKAVMRETLAGYAKEYKAQSEELARRGVKMSEHPEMVHQFAGASDNVTGRRDAMTASRHDHTYPLTLEELAARRVEFRDKLKIIAENLKRTFGEDARLRERIAQHPVFQERERDRLLESVVRATDSSRDLKLAPSQRAEAFARAQDDSAKLLARLDPKHPWARSIVNYMVDNGLVDKTQLPTDMRPLARPEPGSFRARWEAVSDSISRWWRGDPAINREGVAAIGAQPVEAKPVPKDQLKIEEALLSEEAIRNFHNEMAEIFEDLKKAPAQQAGDRARNALFDYLAREGLGSDAIKRDQVTVSFDANATRPQVKYLVNDQEVTRRGTEFINLGGQPVNPAQVKTQITLPQSMLSSTSGQLASALYQAYLERATQSPTAEERAGIRDVVTTALKEHLPPPEARPATGRPDGLIDAALPPEVARKPVQIELTDRGVRFAGVERELTFAEAWKAHVDNLKNKLKEEEGKKGTERNDQKIKDLTEQVAREEAFLTRLSDPKHPDHALTVEAARERLREFRPNEGEVARRAREAGAHDGTRSRLVALTSLISFFLATQAQAGEKPKVVPPPPAPPPAVPAAPPVATPPVPPADAPVRRTSGDAAPDAGDPAETFEASADVDERPEQPAATETQNLKDLPGGEMTQQALLRALPGINMQIELFNATAPEGQKRQPIDAAKIQKEWEEGQFGPESRRLWRDAQTYLQQDALRLGQMLDARGLKLPPGAPFATRTSDSGTGLRETDEMFRARLRKGDVSFGPEGKKLDKPGDLPTKEETDRLINTVMWVGKAGVSWQKAFIEGQAAFVRQGITDIEGMSRGGPLRGWMPPERATPEQLEKWTVSAAAWMDTVTKVRDYADTIAAFNAATTTTGTDFPSLTQLFKKIKGVDGEAMKFPDDALKDENFKDIGRVIRAPNGAIERIELNLPTSLERTKENLEKMAKLEAWLAKWAPQVDQVSREVAAAMADQDRILLNVDDSEIQQSRQIAADELRKYNPELKGDASDVGKPVKMPDGQVDWRIGGINTDGSYQLRRAAPNGEDFNMKRYGFETVKVNAKGERDDNGDYVKVTGYQDYVYARFYSYNNWWGLNTVHRTTSHEPQIYHKNDRIPIMDNGRVRLLPAGQLDAFLSAQKWARETGNVATAAVDVGMIATGVYEARAAYLAARAGGEVAMRQIVKESLKATWHLGLGLTGFGKQAIINTFGDAGHKFNHLRHYAVMADLTFQLTPASFQRGVWDGLWRTKGMTSAMEAYNGTTLFDKALKATHHIFEGGKLLPYTPQIGVFPLADYYFLADFSNTLASLKPGKDQWSPLTEAMLRQGDKYRPADKPVYMTPENFTAEQMRQASLPALNDYAAKLGPRYATTEQARQIEAAVKEAAKLPADSADRKRVADQLLNTFNTSTVHAEKLAAARGLVALTGKEEASIKAFLQNSPLEIAARAESITQLPLTDAGREAFRKQLIETYQTTQDANARVAAARALLKLSVDGEGKPVEVAAATPGAAPPVTRAQLTATEAVSADGLMRRSSEFLFLKNDDPRKAAFAAEAGKVFHDRNAGEEARVAAAFVLMSMRTSDDVKASVGGVQLGDALGYLRSRALDSTSPYVKMAAGDMLMRTARGVEQSSELLRGAVADTQAKLKADPKNEQLKAELEKLQTRLDNTSTFQSTARYSAADYAALLMNMAKDKSVPRELRMEAIASANGPRLAAIFEDFRHRVEPDLNNTTDMAKRTRGMSDLYGRDSEAIQKFLEQMAADKNEDADMRALAAQTLVMNSMQRPTINGVPLTPGTLMRLGTAGEIKAAGESIQPHHAVMTLSREGDMMVRDLGQPGDTWIVRRNGTVEPVGSDWAKLKPGDRVRLGDKDKGNDVFMSDERTEALARLGAQVKLTAGEAPGQLSAAYYQNLKDQLAADVGPRSGATQPARDEAMVAKYRATMAALAVGPAITGGDVAQYERLVADSLSQCAQSRIPEIASSALAQLNQERIAAMSFRQQDALREAALRVLGRTANDPASAGLQEKFLERMPELFAGGTKEQKTRAANMLECMLLENASAAISARDTTINYPLYQSSNPALRIKALETLAKTNPDRAAEVSQLLLLGGTYEGKPVKPDVATVRLAAVETLSKTQPMELGALALKALRTENDPAVSAALFNVEYGARRPDLDPARTLKELTALKERLLQRAQPGYLQEGKEIWDATVKARGHQVQAVNYLRNLAGGDTGDINSKAAQDARKAMIYLLTQPSFAGIMENEASVALIRAVGRQGDKLAKELAGPIEAALMSNPRMTADAREALVAAYINLKPGQNGVVSKEEAAVVLATVLQMEQENMDRTPGSINYERSRRLQETIIDQLKDMPTDKVLPILAAMGLNQGILDATPSGLPTQVQYSPKLSRRFDYDDKDNLLSFTEMRAGSPPKTYKREGGPESTTFRSDDGEVLHNVRVNKETSSTNQRDLLQFSHFLVRGEQGDFSYRKGETSYVVKPNGMVIEETLDATTRRVKYTYPGGESTREFVFQKQPNGDVAATVTSKPDGKTDSWTVRIDDRVRMLVTEGQGDLKSAMVTSEPFQLDRGEYRYRLGGANYFSDAAGGQYKIAGKDTTVLKAAPNAGTMHPIPSVGAAARTLQTQILQTTSLPKQAAEANLAYVEQQRKANPKFESTIGGGRTTEQLADKMGEALANSTADAHLVSKTLYEGMLSKPITGADDPRLIVLRAALNDKNDLVRLTAAKLLAASPDGADRQAAIFAAVEISKNSYAGGLRGEAKSFVDSLEQTSKQIIERAKAETPTAPRLRDSARLEEALDVRDVRYQRKFEQVRRALLDGRPQPVAWSGDDFARFINQNKLPLLTMSGVWQAEEAAIKRMEDNRGSVTSFLMNEKEKEAAREQERKGVTPQIWAQFNSLVQLAMQKGDLDPVGRDARQALAYIMTNNADTFLAERRPEAMDRASKAIRDICVGKSPGRGDMEWIVRTVLTERPDLDVKHKDRMADALSALAGDGGKLSNEYVAGIASLALEQQFRFGPKPGTPQYAESIAYQKKLLGILEKHGNRDLSVAMDFFIENHPDQGIRDQAKATKATIEGRAVEGTQRLVTQMLTDTNGTFSTIRDARDPRLPLLNKAVNDTSLPVAQRARAAEILMDKNNTAVPADQRQSAATMYSRIALFQEGDTARYQAAMLMFDHTNPLFNAEDRRKAAVALADMSISSTDSAIRERAAVAVEKVTGNEVPSALNAMLAAARVQHQRNAAGSTEAVVTAFDTIARLHEKSERSPESQAVLMKAAEYAKEWLGADHPSYKALNEAVKAELLNPQTKSLQGPTDPRLAPVRDALTGNDEALAMAAVELALRPDSKAPPEIAQQARFILYQQLDSLVGGAMRLPPGKAADEAWKQIDEKLARIGEGENDYSRRYVQMKRLEMQGGQEAKLLPIYQRLAELSEERKATEAARLFRDKEQRARTTIEGGDKLSSTNEEFLQAQQAATQALQSKDSTDLANAEKKLNAVIDEYAKLAGGKSVQLADAYTALSKFYAAQGKMDKAGATAQKAVDIYQGHAARTVPQRTQAMATLAMSMYGDPAKEGDFKKLTKVLASPDDAGFKSVPIENGEVLRDLVDYMVSRGAIGQDALKDAEAMMRKAVDARTQSFGEGSTQAAEGYQQMAQFLLNTNQGAKATGMLQQAVGIYQNMPGMEKQVGTASAQLAASYAATGQYAQAQAAYESSIATMTRPGANASPVDVMRQIGDYTRMLEQQGRLDKASEWRQRMVNYQSTGSVGPISQMPNR